MYKGDPKHLFPEELWGILGIPEEGSIDVLVVEQEPDGQGNMPRYFHLGYDDVWTEG